MWELIKILFFGKAVLLTPIPIDIDVMEPQWQGQYEIVMDKPISAITGGARIEIDVTEMIDVESFSDYRKIRQQVESKFPPGSIEILLVGEENTKIYSTEFSSIGKDSVSLIVGDIVFPIGVSYSKAIITSYVTLERVKVIWKNYRM